MTNRHIPRCFGITLIELLVSIGVLMLLLGGLLISYNKKKKLILEEVLQGFC